jgi:hypothetical protein
MKRLSLFALLFLTSLLLQGQNFEGWIQYKLELKNPDETHFPDSAWQALLQKQFGPRGYMLQKNYYKGKQYFSELDTGKEHGVEAYNPKSGLIYAWKNGSDSATTINSRVYIDEIKSIIHKEDTMSILGIPCKSMVIKSKIGELVVWYNPEYMKMDPALYKNHVYGHMESILKEIGCLPLRIEHKSGLVQLQQTLVDYREVKLNKSLFQIPRFKVVTKNPIN